MQTWHVAAAKLYVMFIFVGSDLVSDLCKSTFLKSQSVANPFSLKSQDRCLVALEK